MNIQVLRYGHGKEDTLSLISVDASWVCYGLEDEYRVDKVPGETRIPFGNFQLGLRTKGGFHKRYGHRFGVLHEGMLQVMDVPGFERILIHCGNRADDTSGCLLVGDTANMNKVEEGFLGHSAQAYVRLYRLVLPAVKEGRCSITFTSL